MFNQKHLAVLSASLLAIMLSCSEDKEEYTATFPEFVGLQAQNLDTSRGAVLTVQHGGSYRVTLVASYDVAGIGNAQVPSSQRLPNNGGDISYKASTIKYVVTLSKVFQIQE